MPPLNSLVFRLSSFRRFADSVITKVAARPGTMTWLRGRSARKGAAFSEADDTQSSGQQTQVGATATFGPLLRQAMTKVKQLDAFMQNLYKGNATKLGEWQTASRVQRAAKRTKQASGVEAGVLTRN